MLLATSSQAAPAFVAGPYQYLPLARHEATLPAAGTAYQDGDTVHAMLPVDRSSQVAQILAKAPAKESQ